MISKALHIAAQPKVRGAACHVPCFSQGFHSRQPTLSCKPASFSRHSLHCITFHSLSIAHARCVWVIGIHTLNAHNHKLHSLPAQGSFHFISFHSFLLQSASLQSTGCHCCARLRCRPGCGLSCFLHPHFVGHRYTNRFQQPFSHTSKKSRQPLFGVAAPRQSIRTFPAAFLIARSRAPSFLSARSLLTPYLLLADSLRGGPFVRLGGSQSDSGHRSADTQLFQLIKIALNN